MTSHLRAQADECHATAHTLRMAAARHHVAETARLLHIPEQAVIDTINNATRPTQPPATTGAQDVPLF